MQKQLFQCEQPDRHAGIYIGCAGWGLSSANKHLFPTQGNHLERYATVFPCVEINTSFYRLHRADTYARWRDSVPDGFRFSVKLLRTITHFKRLQDCESDLLQFLETVRPLQRKWGCLLVQFPPSFSWPESHAQRFFMLLRERVSVDIVCEPRHSSWFRDEVIAWMTDAGITYAHADPPPVQTQMPINSDSLTQYIRLHGSPVIYHSSYPETYLVRLAERLRADFASGRRSWCIFDNTASGAAIENALSLLSKINLAQSARAIELR